MKKWDVHKPARYHDSHSDAFGGFRIRSAQRKADEPTDGFAADGFEPELLPMLSSQVANSSRRETALE